MNAALKSSLMHRFVAAGGSPTEFEREFPEILRRYRIDSTLDNTTVTAREEFAAFFRSRNVAGVPE